MGKMIFHKPGLLTTVQDLGRYGYQKFGMPVSGAMDTYSLNKLFAYCLSQGTVEIIVSIKPPDTPMAPGRLAASAAQLRDHLSHFVCRHPT